MILKIKAFRLTGDRGNLNEILTWVRHITWKEFSDQDIIIIILENDYDSMVEACKKRPSISFELLGSANMAVTDKVPV